MCIRMSACMCVPVHPWKQEEDVRSLTCLLPYSLETGALTELGVRLAASKLHRSSCLHSSTVMELQVLVCENITWLFMPVMRIRNQVLILAQQIFTAAEPSPRPLSDFIADIHINRGLSLPRPNGRYRKGSLYSRSYSFPYGHSPSMCLEGIKQ